MPQKVKVLVAVILALSWVGTASGALYTVTSTADDGTSGTLRWAINSANGSAGLDSIWFAIPAAGVQTIFPSPGLPPLTDSKGVEIDGTTQGSAGCGTSPPSTANLLIEIDGANAGSAHGLWVQSSNNIIKGLIINNFEQDGICVESGIANEQVTNNVIECCFIGTNPAGTSDKGNGRNTTALWAGIHIKNVPYGTTVENLIDGCLISGNWAEGVWVDGPRQPGDVGFTHIQNNYIGTDINGTTAIQNDHEGIDISEGGHDNDIFRNLISGNGWDGVGIQGYSNEPYSAPPIYSHSNHIIENIIGLDISGGQLGNGYHGVAIGEYGPPRPPVTSQWGFAPGNVVDTNTIAFNGGDGVAVWEDSYDFTNADSNLITKNRIYDNRELGIDLQNDGVTLNDVGDPDARANQELNFPVIDSAIYNAGNTTIYGTLSIDVTPTTATVEVFKADLDPTGYGEGAVYLGSTTPVNAAGNWSLTTIVLTVGDSVTATATDQNRNTSEFSAAVDVTGQQPPVWDCTDNPPDNKTGGGLESEPNDVCTNANAAVCETAYCGDLGGGTVAPDLEDWWAITIPSDTCYCLHVRVFADATPGTYATGGGLDPELTVYDDDCTTQLFYNGDHNGTFPDAEGTDAQYDCLDAGNCHFPNKTVYLKIGIQGQTAGPYLLVINCIPCECPDVEPDTCDYYKPGYLDYCPNGMPDFDQKQDSWFNPASGAWSHCGPVALANCFWWFDSKFEPNPQVPPTVSDGYPLLQTFTAGTDDHVAANVMPFVDSLAVLCSTNVSGSGTNVFDLATGAQDWLDAQGLGTAYTIQVVPIDPVFGFEYIREQVLLSQDVILLLGFWEEVAGADPPYCERVGGHYVTMAGACRSASIPCDSAICISDPFFDNQELFGHAANVHNDAQYISGPHGTYYHDKYYVMPVVCDTSMMPFRVEVLNYPIDPGNVLQFQGQNSYDNTDMIDPMGGPIHTIIEYAVVICPAEEVPEPTPGKVKHNIDGYIPTEGSPIGTLWHELWPEYCQTWELTSWEDNGDKVLSYCDNVDFTDPETGRKRWEHIEKVTPTIRLEDPTGVGVDIYLDFLGDNPNVDPMTDPVGTYWHEVYPNYCTIWQITGWTDNQNEYLDSCDYVLITTQDGFEERELHVVGYQTDIVTTPLPTPGDEYDHNIDGYLPHNGDPTGTLWDELHPNYGDEWTLDEWRDNGDGYLSYCDTIKFVNPQMPDTVLWKHVEEVTPTVKLALGSDTIYADYMCGNYTVAPIDDPTGTYWLQVYPNTLVRRICTGWIDNGNQYVDSCDVLYLEVIDGADSGTVAEWHVEQWSTDIVTTYLEVDECCDYYKSPYPDYAPYGMPDFDQKSPAWVLPGGVYTHCGPVALANCFWWFDSKFEPNPQTPPIVSDGYPLVRSYKGPAVDDHDTANVEALVDTMWYYLGTNQSHTGTDILDMLGGAHDYLDSIGLVDAYDLQLIRAPEYGLIYEEVSRSQDVILLLGFYELQGPNEPVRLGGHYVTVAGVCSTNPVICISDPWYDKNEGEPPAGNAHTYEVHHDAANISGPHGQIQHDDYRVALNSVVQPTFPPIAEVVDYPDSWTYINNFFDQNWSEWHSTPSGVQGDEIFTLIDYALVICPLDTCGDQNPGDADSDGDIDDDDIEFIRACIESGGPAPNPKANGDPNGDCIINYADTTYLHAYLHQGGPPPVTCTCVDPEITCCIGITGNVDDDSAHLIDIGDLTALISYLYIPPNPEPPCLPEANIDGDSAGLVDIGDLTALISYLYIPPNPTPAHCP
jgi:hypothetical protein